MLMVQGIDAEKCHYIKNVGKAHKQTVLVIFSLAYITPFLYLYSRNLTGKRCKKKKKIRTSFSNSFWRNETVYTRRTCS
jgi:hypothetical protein